MKTKVLALACTATLIAGPALSQRNCAEHAMVVERLASGYGETRQSIALGSDNSVVEIFASLETGSWTITMTQAGGPTCLVASGQSFQMLNETLPTADNGA